MKKAVSLSMITAFGGILTAVALCSTAFAANEATEINAQSRNACDVLVAQMKLDRFGSESDYVEFLRMEALRNQLAGPAVQTLNRAKSRISSRTVEAYRVYKTLSANANSILMLKSARRALDVFRESLEHDLDGILGVHAIKQTRRCDDDKAPFYKEEGYMNVEFKEDYDTAWGEMKAVFTGGGYQNIHFTFRMNKDGKTCDIIELGSLWDSKVGSFEARVDNDQAYQLDLVLDENFVPTLRVATTVYIQSADRKDSNNLWFDNTQFVAKHSYSLEDLVKAGDFTVESSGLGAGVVKRASLAEQIYKDKELPLVCRKSGPMRELIKQEMAALNQAKGGLDPVVYAREKQELNNAFGSSSAK